LTSKQRKQHMFECLKKIVSVRVLEDAFMKSSMRSKRNEPSRV
jgi:hypothetical protein